MTNSYWFKHDDNARNDEHIQNLVYEMGFEGYGLYWSIIEDLIKNDGYLDTNYKRIAYALRVEKLKVKQVIERYDLFVIKKNRFTSKRVLRELDDREAKIKRAKKGAEARWSNRDKEKESGSNANGNAQAYAQADAYIDREDKDIDREDKDINREINKEKDKEKDKRLTSEKFTEFDLYVSKGFLDYQKERYPKLVNNKIKSIENGADTIRLLREQDDFTENEITGTLKFALKDKFWQDKVFSIANIRTKSKNGNTKFQNIYLKYKNKPKTRTEQVMDIDLSEGENIWSN